MFSQIIDLLKDSVATTLGLVMSVFGVANSQIADISQTVDIDTIPTEEVITADTVISTEALPEPLSAPTVLEEEPTEKVETEYFERDNLKTPVFSRADALVAQGATVATEGELRSVNPIKNTTEIKSAEVDPTLLLGTDLDKFDIELKITEITENIDSYFIKYEYKTFLIKENVWQIGLKQEGFSVTKGVLKDQNLEDYLSKELAEIVDNEILYLKEIKNILKKKILDNQQEKVSEFDKLIGKKISSQAIKNTAVAIMEDSGDVEQETTSVEEENITSPSDTEAPLIIIQGNNPALVQKGSSYSDLGVIVRDNVTVNLGYQVEGDIVNTEVEGSYYITYTARDEANNTATATREVIVYAYDEPVVEQITPIVEEEATPVEEVTPIPIIEDIATTTEIVEEPLVAEEVVEVSDSLDTGEVLIETAKVITENVVEGAKQVNKKVNKKVKEVTETVVETTTETLEAVSEGVEAVSEEVSVLIKQVKFLELLGNIKASLQTGVKNTGTNLQAGILNVSSALWFSTSNFGSILQASLNNLAPVFQANFSVVGEETTGFLKTVGQFFQPVVEEIQSGLNFLKEISKNVFRKIGLDEVIYQTPSGVLANISDYNKEAEVAEEKSNFVEVPEYPQKDFLVFIGEELTVLSQKVVDKAVDSFSLLATMFPNALEFLNTHRPHIE